MGKVMLDESKPKFRFAGDVSDLVPGAFWTQGGRIFNQAKECIAYEPGPCGDRAKEADGADTIQPPESKPVVSPPELKPNAETPGDESQVIVDAPTGPVDEAGLTAQLNALHANKIKEMMVEEGLEPATGKGSKATNIATLVAKAVAS